MTEARPSRRFADGPEFATGPSNGAQPRATSSWSVVRLEAGLKEHAREWDALNQQAFGSHPMLTSGFVDGLLQNFGDGSEYLCRYVDGNRVRGLCILKRRNALVWSSFLPSQGQIGPTLIPDAELLFSLLRSLPGRPLQLDLLCNDPTLGAVLAQPLTHHRNHNFTMTIGLNGTFDEYWASRSKRLQSNIRRYEKRLVAEQIAKRYVRLSAPHDIEAALQRYARLEGEGWKGKNGTSLASSAAQFNFYLELMTAGAACGEASAHELWFDGELAASRLILTRSGAQVMLKTTYAEKYSTFAPGRLLLRAVIEEAFAINPGGRIEFCTDAAPDLLGWATGHRWIQHTSLYRSPFAGRMILGVRALSKRRAVLRNDLVENSDLSSDVYTHPDSLPADAQKLLNRGELVHFEFGTSWYRNLVDTVYPGDSAIRFYVLRRAEKIIGVLPLRAEKVLFGWRLHSLSNGYTHFYEPAFEPGLKSREFGFLLSAIHRDFPGLASFRLAPMNPQSAAYQTMIEALQLRGWLPFGTGRFACPDRSIVLTNSAPCVGSNESLESKFNADGGRLEVATGAEGMASAVAAVEAAFAKANSGAHQDFIGGFLRTYAASGCLRLGLAWLDSKPIAAHVWVVAHGRATIYAWARDEAFADYGADKLVEGLLATHVTEADAVSELAYVSDSGPINNSWISRRNERRSLVAYNALSVRGLMDMARESFHIISRRAAPAYPSTDS